LDPFCSNACLPIVCKMASPLRAGRFVIIVFAYHLKARYTFSGLRFCYGNLAIFRIHGNGIGVADHNVMTWVSGWAVELADSIFLRALLILDWSQDRIGWIHLFEYFTAIYIGNRRGCCCLKSGGLIHGFREANLYHIFSRLKLSVVPSFLFVNLKSTSLQTVHFISTCLWLLDQK
jgi:hypothetical protein